MFQCLSKICFHLLAYKWLWFLQLVSFAEFEEPPVFLPKYSWEGKIFLENESLNQLVPALGNLAHFYFFSFLLPSL